MDMAGQTMKETIRVTKALADVQRVRILMLLEKGELCVCQMIEVLGLAPSTVSKHLSLLHSAELVEMRKDGRWAYYQLPDGEAAGHVHALLEWLKQTLENDATVEHDADLLENVLAVDQCEVARGQRCR